MARPRETQDAPAAWAEDPAFAQSVVRWQRQHGRHGLPWQGTRDPYRVWLSEVMLQQTQVSTVLGYYDRFLQRFPDVASLAAAPLDEVLALWSGLGYYSRARWLHQCARQVVTEHGGRFPESSAQLAALPGIGASTAAAIAAFCFGERAAILDGNVKRVLARALGFGADLARPASERALWERARALLPQREVATYTQGLMDLGAQVCTLRRPRCIECPLEPRCVAAREGDPLRYPVRLRRLRRTQRCSALLWLTHGEQVWLSRRPDQGVWAGLWSLPEWPQLSALQSVTGNWPGRGQVLDAVEHELTHFHWTLQPWRWQLPQGLSARRQREVEAALGSGRWFDLEAALTLGLPAPVRRLLSAGA